MIKSIPSCPLFLCVLPSVQFQTSVEHRGAIQIGAHAGGGGRGVGHFGGVCVRDEDLVGPRGQAQNLGGDLDHFGVEALAHLDAAVAQ